MTNSVSKTGRISLIGLGPGDLKMTTPNAVDIIRDCDVIVGYKGYIDQIGDLISDQTLVSMELGQELDRANRTFELASSGHSVALVSSGDAGIYGMAGPLFTVLTEQGWDGVNPDVEVIPGVSALQSAASLLGSPLMQDFCAISLSDLLTPWEIITKRIKAASVGDFVIALYNPRSKARQNHLIEAREILLSDRSPETPVGLVKDAFRPNQSLLITTLGELDSSIQFVDMFTTVIIGNSTTYQHKNRMITPRGYERKLHP